MKKSLVLTFQHVDDSKKYIYQHGNLADDMMKKNFKMKKIEIPHSEEEREKKKRV
jgi:hypothetical protein